MMMSEINFSVDFGSKIKEYQCPHCGDIYTLGEKEVNKGVTCCWKCHRPYLQRACTTNNFHFVRSAIHRNP